MFCDNIFEHFESFMVLKATKKEVIICFETSNNKLLSVLIDVNNFVEFNYHDVPKNLKCKYKFYGTLDTTNYHQRKGYLLENHQFDSLTLIGKLIECDWSVGKQVDLLTDCKSYIHFQ